MRVLVLISTTLLILSSSAFAQLAGSDTAPGDSCVGFPTGAARVTADADGNGSEITLVCSGGVWTTPGIKIPYDTAACSSAKEGTLRFASATDTFEFCNGSAWTPFKSSTYTAQTMTQYRVEVTPTAASCTAPNCPVNFFDAGCAIGQAQDSADSSGFRNAVHYNAILDLNNGAQSACSHTHTAPANTFNGVVCLRVCVQ
jgi:hypothetical protein